MASEGGQGQQLVASNLGRYGNYPYVPDMKPVGHAPQNAAFVGQTTMTTSTMTVTTSLPDGSMTIKRMKQMAQEQHHRNVELQTANCHLTTKLKQTQDELDHLRKSFLSERQLYEDMRTKQHALDKHIDDFSGILETIDVKHLKLNDALHSLQAHQKASDADLAQALSEVAQSDAGHRTNFDKCAALEDKLKTLEISANHAHLINKELSEELAKHQTLIAEKSKQAGEANEKLEALRSTHSKLEASFSETKATGDANLRQRTAELTSAQDELSRTVNNLNEMLVARQKDAEAHKHAKQALHAERRRTQQCFVLLRKALEQFERQQCVAQSNLSKALTTHAAKWSRVVLASTCKVKAVRGTLAGLKDEAKAKQDNISGLSQALARTQAEKALVEGRLDRVAVSLDEKTGVATALGSEVKAVGTENAELRAQLVSLKEEQKAYLYRVSNQNASELQKMKLEMTRQVEEVRQEHAQELKAKTDALDATDRKLRTANETLAAAARARAEAEQALATSNEAHASAMRALEQKHAAESQALASNHAKAVKAAEEKESASLAARERDARAHSAALAALKTPAAALGVLLDAIPGEAASPGTLEAWVDSHLAAWEGASSSDRNAATRQAVRAGFHAGRQALAEHQALLGRAGLGAAVAGTGHGADALTPVGVPASKRRLEFATPSRKRKDVPAAAAPKAKSAPRARSRATAPPKAKAKPTHAHTQAAPSSKVRRREAEPKPSAKGRVGRGARKQAEGAGVGMARGRGASPASSAEGGGEPPSVGMDDFFADDSFLDPYAYDG